MSVGCYHCGEAIPAGADFTVLVDGGQKSVCCQGCQAVAECILGAGLDDYYRLRSAAAVTPSNGSDDYSRFDNDALIEEFSQKDGQYWISRFSVGGLRCAACAWLIEHHLQGIDGVESINVHLQNAVATVTWNPDLLQCPWLPGPALVGGQPRRSATRRNGWFTAALGDRRYRHDASRHGCHWPLRW